MEYRVLKIQFRRYFFESVFGMIFCVTFSVEKVVFQGQKKHIFGTLGSLPEILLLSPLIIGSKQDKVNTADSAFIFLINLLISQNKWPGWTGRRRWSCLVWSLLER